MLGLLNKTLLNKIRLLAVLRWKFALRISCPCPWFRPQSSTANLFGFNQSSPWLMIFFFLFPFLTCLLSVKFSSHLSLSTQHFVFPPTLSAYLSTCLFFSMLLLAISMLMWWLCFGNFMHKNLADPQTYPIKQSVGSSHWNSHRFESLLEGMGGRVSLHKGNKRTRYPWPNLTGLYDRAIDVTMALMNSNFADSWADE